MRSINLHSLQLFADVISLGSFTAAAERNGLTQPAVSFHIRQLEERFGATLVERQGRRAMPTVAGAELLRHAARIDAAVGDAVVAMARFAPGKAGRLRIGAGATACIALLPPILRSLRETLPALEVSAVTGNSLEITRAIEDDEVDAGIVTMPVSGRMLAVEPLFDDEIVLLGPGSLELPDEITPAVLLDYPPILFEPEGVTRSLIDGWFARAGVSFYPAMSLGSVEAVRELVGMGLGCALFPRMVLSASEEDEGRVVRALTPRLQRTIGVVTRRDQSHSAGLEAFLDALRRECSRRGGVA